MNKVPVEGEIIDDTAILKGWIILGSEIKGQILFEADTGASTTVLSSSALFNLKIDPKKLEEARRPIRTPGGVAKTLALPDISLLLFDKKEGFIPHFLGKVPVIPDPKRLPVSVIGQDILSQYNLIINRKLNIITLKKV